MPTPLRTSALLGAALALSLGALAPAALLADPAAAATTTTTSSPSGAADVQRHLPRHWESRTWAVANRTGIESPARAAVTRAIDPGDYECAPTDLDTYVGQVLDGLDASDLEFLVYSGVLDFPTYDALFFGTQGDSRYALREQATDITHVFRDARRFWDIQSADIQLLAMHGSVLTDQARLVRLLTVVYGMSEVGATDFASYVVRTVRSIPELQGGDNPIFTLNAFAFSGAGARGLVGATPDKLVVGDGIIDALQAMGIDDVGLQAVLGHEFAHHVQYEKHLFDSPLTGAEATRRTELMADAMGTYFVTHKRGLALNARRVLEAEQTFYEVGDCQFASDGHHGTPQQRHRASAWGAALARGQQKQGHVLPALAVADRFEQALAGIVAPDAA